MRTTLSDLGRWLAICGLWLLIGLLIVPTAVMHWLSGGGLAVIEVLKDRVDDLRGKS
jgi:hypothetical protein